MCSILIYISYIESRHTLHGWNRMIKINCVIFHELL